MTRDEAIQVLEEGQAVLAEYIDLTANGTPPGAAAWAKVALIMESLTDLAEQFQELAPKALEITSGLAQLYEALLVSAPQFENLRAEGFGMPRQVERRLVEQNVDIDQRIMNSQKTYYRCQEMAKEGVFPASDHHLVADEIRILQSIAEVHPKRSHKVGHLIESWQTLAHRMRAALN